MKNINKLSIIGIISILCVACTSLRLEDKKKENIQVNPSLEVSTTSMNSEKNMEYVLGKATEESLRENIINISQYDRSLNSKEKEKAIDYIINNLNELGYNSYIQNAPVYYQESYLKEPKYDEIIGETSNLIAEHINNKPNQKTIYLTAHYDNTPNNTSGVIDNASGVTVLMELAKMLQHYNKNLNIIFVFLDSEEHFLQGSRAFVKNLSNLEKEKILGVINVDMVGELGAGDIIMKFGTGEHNVLSLMWNHILNNKTKIDIGIMTDEVSFKEAKIPAITLENSNPNLSISNEENQLQYIDYEQLLTITKDIATFINEFDMNYYNKLLNNEIDLKSNWSSLSRIYYIENANIIDTGLNLTENGAVNEGIFTYQTTNGKMFKISIIPGIFWDNNDHLQFNSIINEKFSKPVMYYHIDENESGELTITYYNQVYYGKLQGNISESEAIEILSSFHQSTCYGEYIVP